VGKYKKGNSGDLTTQQFATKRTCKIYSPFLLPPFFILPAHPPAVVYV